MCGDVEQRWGRQGGWGHLTTEIGEGCSLVPTEFPEAGIEGDEKV
jgi:hypothetical protein